MNMELRQELTSEQQQGPSQRLEQWQRAPILYNLHSNIDGAFIRPLRETIAKNPQGKTAVFITGEPGSGKEILGGQLLDTLLHPVNPESVSPLPENLRIGYLSLGMALKVGRNKELAARYGEQPIEREHGAYQKEDYEKASRILTKLIEEFYDTDSYDPHLLLVETVAFTHPALDHGGSTIQDQVDKTRKDRDRDVFLLGVAAHPEIQALAVQQRTIAATNALPEELMKTFVRHDMEIDRDMQTQADVAEFSQTRGAPGAVEKVRRVIDDNIYQYRRSLRRINPCYSSDPTDEELFGGEERRTVSRIAYFEHVAQDQFHIKPGNVLISQNTPFRRSADLQKFPHYRTLLQKYALVT